jgi:hypothetical protein
LYDTKLLPHRDSITLIIEIQFILQSASEQTERSSFHQFPYYRNLTTECFSYFSNTYVLFLQILKTVDRVELASEEDWEIKADRHNNLTAIYTYVVNQQMHTGKLCPLQVCKCFTTKCKYSFNIDYGKLKNKLYNKFSLLYLNDVV